MLEAPEGGGALAGVASAVSADVMVSWCTPPTSGSSDVVTATRQVKELVRSVTSTETANAATPRAVETAAATEAAEAVNGRDATETPLTFRCTARFGEVSCCTVMAEMVTSTAVTLGTVARY